MREIKKNGLFHFMQTGRRESFFGNPVPVSHLPEDGLEEAALARPHASRDAHKLPVHHTTRQKDMGIQRGREREKIENRNR